MFPKKSVILFAAGWMLLALVALPAHASAASSLDPSTVAIDTFPVFENAVSVRQAHIAWLAAKEEAGMQATIAYVASVNGSTTTLATIFGNFRQSQAALGTADTHAALDIVQQDFRQFSQAFREESAARIKTLHGNPGFLRQSLQSAVVASARVRSLEDQYWQTRATTELAAFDLRVERARALLTALRSNDYEITAAQEKFTEITIMRTELATALNLRDDTGIEQAHKKIHTASLGFVQAVRGTRLDASHDTNLRQTIGQGSAVMTRAGRINTELNTRGLGTRALEQYVSDGTAQLAAAAARLDNGKPEDARATLLQFRSTVQSLRDAYRSVLVKEDLPRTTAQGVLSVAQSLDITAARMLAL
ncbi:MAG: hypothetical protein ACYDDV_10155 [Methanoregula sp.]